MNHPLATYLKHFFSHYLPVQKGLSPHTVAAYRDAVKLLLCYAADTLKLSVDAISVEAITAALVSDFLDYLEHERGCRTSTRNARLAAIRCLFAFIAREEPVLVSQCQAIRAIPLKRGVHKTIDYLEESEMQALLDAVDIDSRTGVRDRALLMVLYNTGARVSEIVGLTLHDLRRVLSARVRSRRFPGPRGQAERAGGPVRNLTGQSRRCLGRACWQKLEQLPETRPQSGGDRSGASRFPSAMRRFKVSR